MKHCVKSLQLKLAEISCCQLHIFKNPFLCFFIQTVGRELLLHLIDYLVTSYQHDPVVTRLMNSTRIHILPSMNPDGFETEKYPSCQSFKGRSECKTERSRKLEIKWLEAVLNLVNPLVYKYNLYSLVVLKLVDRTPWGMQPQVRGVTRG